MIYRILVDDRRHTKLFCSDNVANIHTLRLLEKETDASFFEPLLKIKHMRFSTIVEFERALSDSLSKKQFARLGRETIDKAWLTVCGSVPVTLPWDDKRDRRLGGAGYGWLADVMEDRGLVAPDTKNPRLRYYFTERGWRIVGRHVAAEARRLGHLVKVICLKNPNPSQVAYCDQLQIAILQDRNRSK